MVAEPTEWERRLLRDASALPARLQRSPRRLAAIALAGLATVVLACLVVAHIRDRRALADSDRAVIRAASANADLQDFVARLQNELGARTHDLAATRQHLAAATATGSQLSQQQDQAQQQLAAAQATAASKTHNIAALSQTLDKAQHELHLEAAQRATLAARLDRAEADQAQGVDRQAQAQAGLADAQHRLQLLTAEQSRTAAERDHLRARVGELEQQIASALRPTPKPVAAAKPAVPPTHVAAAAPPRVAPATAAAPTVAVPAAVATTKPAALHPAAAVAATKPPPVAAAPHPVAAAPARAGAPVAEARGPIGRIERLLASTGVDVSRLFAKYGVERAEGGPFMPLRDRPPVEKLSAEKLAVLRMAKSLPLAAPVDHYRLASPFGARHDPINGHDSFHTGVDLAAPYESPVYATAAGTVTFAGFRNDYGRIVEIDHGNGISTRYAHLHRLLVSVGEKVAAHAEIGLLGTSGRSTGPHVHYEVLVNGEPQNPERFIEMSRVVAVATR